MIQRLQETDNKELRVVEIWLGDILEDYITEFVVDTTNSYIELEKEFLNVLRGSFLLSLQLSIKMLVYEKGILKMHLE